MFITTLCKYSHTHDQVPVNLLRCSRLFTFEPPPGVKASLLRTFGTVPAARMAKVQLFYSNLWLIITFLYL